MFNGSNNVEILIMSSNFLKYVPKNLPPALYKLHLKVMTPRFCIPLWLWQKHCVCVRFILHNQAISFHLKTFPGPLRISSTMLSTVAISRVITILFISNRVFLQNITMLTGEKESLFNVFRGMKSMHVIVLLISFLGIIIWMHVSAKKWIILHGHPLIGLLVKVATDDGVFFWQLLARLILAVLTNSHHGDCCSLASVIFCLLLNWQFSQHRESLDQWVFTATASPAIV